jgi:hypothetical protein
MPRPVLPRCPAHRPPPMCVLSPLLFPSSPPSRPPLCVCPCHYHPCTISPALLLLVPLSPPCVCPHHCHLHTISPAAPCPPTLPLHVPLPLPPTHCLPCPTTPHSPTHMHTLPLCMPSCCHPPAVSPATLPSHLHMLSPLPPASPAALTHPPLAAATPTTRVHQCHPCLPCPGIRIEAHTTHQVTVATVLVPNKESPPHSIKNL